ncbi:MULTISPECIES: hypothetical protein [Bradyrhizobium]|jgi:hypothetical protein|uniref:Uncharacterized protein n=1 Tax=Bradyrhizobium denitrificans TaxID=2734912 RepID=A0ABS5GJZ3_9BRAD|nr:MULTISPECIES: hypothetical protein [Bradyrhizobium]MDU6248403.1 hypothetical protein [Paeniclostridium sordellii]NEL16019.1 hypothetical protein [Escherichia coli]MBR1141475.1 hypothetical protein [Bradyrhizobium denitrificans]MDU0957549.1 hypothetical protein [Bradyrhizobium sp.]MDU1497969.1 hypothetical protein [Bradyrhizobium sp.]
MPQCLRLIMAVVATALAMVTASEPVLARGAAANIMNSPGYQRRLQESRQQLGAQPPAPFVAEPRYHSPRYKAKRHRHHHTR